MTRENYHHGDLKNALISAGIEILAEEGLSGLSLRKTARKAGVSHAAPYAHFADKESLLAAIATDGHRRLSEQIELVLARHPADPLRQLVGAAWAYVQFGLEAPAHYKITFSGALQDEHSHAEFVALSQRNLQVLRTIVEACRAAGVFGESELPAELQALSLWALIHGLVLLLIQGQVPGSLLKQVSAEEMFTAALQQVVRLPISSAMLH
jgi:AcrR family transcriptional regulator